MDEDYDLEEKRAERCDIRNMGGHVEWNVDLKREPDISRKWKQEKSWHSNTYI